MRIYGVGTQYGRNLCPQNLRNNRVSFGKIDDDIKDEMYAMAERSPRVPRSVGSNLDLIDALNETKYLHIYGNKSKKSFNCEPVKKEAHRIPVFIEWYETAEGKDTCRNLDMPKISKITKKIINSLTTKEGLQETANKLQEYNDAVDADRYYNADS